MATITYNLPGRLDVGDAVTITPVADASIPTGATWTVSTGSLPAGTSIDAKTGVISGKLTTQGEYKFTVMASDGKTTVTGDQDLTVLIPTTITGDVPAGKINTPFTFTFKVTGDDSAVATLASGSTLPNGVNFDAASKTFSGTPLEGGHFIADVLVDGQYSHAERVFDIEIVTAPTLSYAVNSPTVAVGDAINTAPTYKGQSGACVFAVANGELAAGLKLDASTGVISGNPTTVGSYQANISMTDATGGVAYAEYDTQVVDTLTLQVPDLTTAVGVVASVTPVVAGGLAPYAFSFSGDNMSATTFDSATGKITTLATSGAVTETLTVKVTDSLNRSVTETLKLTINSTISLTYDGTIPQGDVGTPYLLQFTKTGGIGEATGTISVGQLPDGLSISDTDPTVITGTPTKDGIFSFTLKVSDASGAGTYPATVTVNKALTAESSFPLAVVGKPYSHQIVSTGGSANKNYRLTGTVPKNFVTDEQTGIVSGTPDVAGFFSATLQIDDGISQLSRPISVAVANPLSITYTKGYGYPGSALTITAKTSGGSGDLNFSSTDLPNGFTIDGRTGVITGSSTTPITQDITVSVTDDTGSYETTVQLSVINHLFVTDATCYPLVGQSFKFDVGTVVSGGDTVKVFSTTQEPPAGLSFDPKTGLITGTASGVPAVTVLPITVTDNRETKTVNVTLSVCNPLKLVNEPTNAVVGESYSFVFEFSGGSSQKTLTVDATLPDGLTYDSTHQMIYGTPLEDTVVEINWSCSDPSGSLSGKSILNIGPILGITGNIIPAAVGSPYSWGPSVGGGNGTTKFQCSDVLPNGITINPNSGVLYGTPTQKGIFPLDISVTDDIETRVWSGTLIMSDALATMPAVSVTGLANQSFTFSVDTIVGAGVLSYEVTAGTLSAGVTLTG